MQKRNFSILAIVFLVSAAASSKAGRFAGDAVAPGTIEAVNLPALMLAADETRNTIARTEKLLLCICCHFSGKGIEGQGCCVSGPMGVSVLA